MRIAVIAPPWYTVPPSGYGGIEWVVALLANGLTERGHQVTLFAPPGSETEAELVPPLGEVPPEGLIGDPWYEAAHAISAYDRAGEFDLVHDHTGPVGASIGAMSDCPTVHTLHGPFTDQTNMLYRRIARRHWFVAISNSQQAMGPPNLRWAGVVYNGIPLDRYLLQEDKEDFLFFLGRADEEKAPHLPSRRPGGPGGGWSCVSPPRTSASAATGPSRWSRCWVMMSMSGASATRPRRRRCWPGRRGCCFRSSGPSRSGW
jgi:glycosyltransferase involved in cell wall biosynthesis